MISKEEVQRIAKLARLGLTKTEIEKFREELSLILDYIEKLKKIDVSDVQPTSHSFKVENIAREDEVRGSSLEVKRKLMEMAPDKKSGFLKVKSILS